MKENIHVLKYTCTYIKIFFWGYIFSSSSISGSLCRCVCPFWRIGRRHCRWWPSLSILLVGRSARWLVGQSIGRSVGLYAIILQGREVTLPRSHRKTFFTSDSCPHGAEGFSKLAMSLSSDSNFSFSLLFFSVRIEMKFRYGISRLFPRFSSPFPDFFSDHLQY